MCFSAEASFVSGGLILSAAGYNLYKRKPISGKAYLLFIPVLFGVQQISEGFVWLGLDGLIPNPILWFFIYFSVLWRLPCGQPICRIQPCVSKKIN